MSRAALHWLALGVALSPAILEWGRHVIATPSARAALLAPVWLVLAGRARAGDAEVGRGHRDGLVLLAGALAIEWLSLLAGPASLGRLALPVGVAGMARWLGAPGWRAALLALWLVPVPAAILWRVHPEAASALLAAAAWPLQQLGLDVVRSGPSALVEGGGVLLRPADGGLAGAWIAAGVTWFASTYRNAGFSSTVRMLALAAIVTLPLQGLVIMGMLAAAAFVSPDVAPGVLGWAWPVLATGATLFLVRATQRRRAE